MKKITFIILVAMIAFGFHHSSNAMEYTIQKTIFLSYIDAYQLCQAYKNITTVTLEPNIYANSVKIKGAKADVELFSKMIDSLDVQVMLSIENAEV